MHKFIFTKFFLGVAIYLIAAILQETMSISSDHLQQASTINSTTSNSQNRRPSRPTGSNKSSRKLAQQSNRINGANLDPATLAQHQVRLMYNYNNTPPLFVTRTRDFFVDVARHSAGSKITTMTADDLDGDPIEYSIQPASSHDASSHFVIDAQSGELCLSGRPFQLYSTLEELHKPEETEQREKSTSVAGSQLTERNLYFLNVAADDGRYTTIVELQIHVLNSSSLTPALQPLAGAIQLTPDGSRHSSEQLESIIRSKTSEFYDRLHNLPSSSSHNNQSSGALVYPNYVNAGLLRPASDATASEPTSELATAGTSTRATSLPGATEAAPQVVQPQSSGQLQPQLQSQPDKQLFAIEGVSVASSQPMLVSLVVACSCLLIALLLIMFLVPVSIRRLKRRLKNVEVQHEQLSSSSQSGQSLGCPSSAGSLGIHANNSSLSQFTLASSDRSCTLASSTVCRQSSLDSHLASFPALSQASHKRSPLNRINNGSIANPVYLQQQQQQQQQLQHFIFNQPALFPPARDLLGLPMANQTQKQQQNNNDIYTTLEDDFYSTINTESTMLDNVNQASLMRPSEFRVVSNQIGEPIFKQSACLAPTMTNERAANSPNSDSGSSTRSLIRFLSLPARSFVQETNKIENLELENGLKSNNFKQLDCKTIARSENISRETNNSNEKTKRNWELQRYKLKLIDILGEGQFGLVWRCRLDLDDKTEKIVAVKTLKSCALKDERGREDFLAEIEIMKLVCEHPNVVKILNCCTSDNCTQFDPLRGNSTNTINITNPILLVMEYVELGKLQSILQKSRTNHHYTTTSNSYTNNDIQITNDHLTSRDLVKFIYHIAKGMEYISSKCIIHRDLASRNILVSSQRVCKIGDFGMARQMQSFGGIYERHSRNTKIPVRWMAPEVLLNNRFTTKSDVFSFGILMWEIVTLGSTPYRHLMTEQVINEVALNGERPSKPDYCHSQLYKIMSQCWLHDPDDRPTFSWLVKQLDDLLLSANDYIELDQYPDHNYYNISTTSVPFELL